MKKWLGVKYNPTLTFRKIIIILAHAFIGWALCGATMGFGMATTSLQNALIIHATSSKRPARRRRSS